MRFNHLHQLLIRPTAKMPRFQIRVWFGFSLALVLGYGLLALQKAFSGDYIVQDDARQHVFWMQRFIDSDLFPNDLIANYFQSVAPVGYASFYRLGATIGIHPLLLNKLLPLLLGLITAGYFWGLCLEILPIPAFGWLTSLLFHQTLWNRDDLISATPRAFAYPLFVAFLYYFVRRSPLPCLGLIALLGCFYPQFVFLCAGLLIVQLLDWRHGRPCVSKNHSDYAFSAVGLGVALVVMLPYALTASEFGPTISPAIAKQLPEFLQGGRSEFFQNSPIGFWWSGRSGLFPKALLVPPILGTVVLLPFLLAYRSRIAVFRYLTPQLKLLPQLLMVSVGMFLLAHLLLFKLHLPSRYTGYSFRIIVVVAAGIGLFALLDLVLQFCTRPTRLSIPVQQFLGLSLFVMVGTILLFYPSAMKRFLPGYMVGNQPALYAFFQQQPKDSVIAALAREADNLPTFAQRSVLVSQELSIPYHWGYYRQIRQRTIELIQAQYSSTLTSAQALIQRYGVDFWLLDRSAFTPEYLDKSRWLRQFQPTTQQAIAQLQRGEMPALSQRLSTCSVFESQQFVVLRADCILSDRR
jgi:hypothetical protein